MNGSNTNRKVERMNTLINWIANGPFLCDSSIEQSNLNVVFSIFNLQESDEINKTSIRIKPAAKDLSSSYTAPHIDRDNTEMRDDAEKSTLI